MTTVDLADHAASVLRSRSRWFAAVAVGLSMLMAAGLLISGGFIEASRWTVRNSEVLWIPGLADGMPYRPPLGVEARTVRDAGLLAPDVVQISHDFRVTSARPEPMTVLLPVVEGDADLFVNGVPVEDESSSRGQYLALTGDRPVMWRVPAEFLRPGPNRLDVIVTGAQRRSLGAPVILGPRDRPTAFLQVLSALADGFRSGLLVLSIAAAMSALAAAAALRASTPWIALSGVAAALGARIVASDPGLPTWLAPYGLLMESLALSAALICLGCALIGPRLERPERVRRWIMGGLATLPLLTVVALFGAWRNSAILSLASWILPLPGLVFLIWASREVVGVSSPASVALRLAQGAAGALLVLTTAAAIVGASNLAWGLWSPSLEVIYGLGLAILLGGLTVLSTYLTARQIWRWVRDRPRLSRIILSQQKEIEATALALEHQIKRSAALEERQQLARDMHDGIGGHLTSLLARVRSGRITPDQLEGELIDGLSELRLMVDSLDASDRSVADALSVLRSRIRSHTDAAQMSLDWSQAERLRDITADVTWVLNLSRLVQEGATNAIRHADASHLAVDLQMTGEKTLTVTVRDNGVGFDRDQVTLGRGLSNLTIRAAQVGGVIVFERDPISGGTVIRADIPIPQAWPVLPMPGSSI